MGGTARGWDVKELHPRKCGSFRSIHPFQAGLGLQEGFDIENMEKAQPFHCKARTLGSPPWGTQGQ